MFRRFVGVWLLATLLLPALVHAADVQATLDRSSVQLGETVTLNLRVEGAGGRVTMPDLAGLGQDFSILGTSQNRSISVVNGTTSSTLTFGIALRPTHVGSLTIPALNVAGSQTRPLQLQVTAPDPAAAAAVGQDVFMEARVEPAHGYVGQQFSYVVRLYYATNISNGSLGAPQVDGVEVSRVGDDLNYDSQRGGRSYHVLERRYALVPRHAGHFDIPALGFQGEAIDPTDPNSFFGASTPISASAPAVSIEVQATPADWGKSAWLPARQLSLSLDGWPGANEQVRVGKPLNLTMTLQATGLPFEALPALSLPALDGATVYPDKPVTGTHNDGPWVVGRRQQAFAVVPERAGTLTLPATTVKWWNVLTDKMEVAQIPARSVTVLPAVGATDVQTSIPAGSASAIAAAKPAVVTPASSQGVARSGGASCPGQSRPVVAQRGRVVVVAAPCANAAGSLAGGAGVSVGAQLPAGFSRRGARQRCGGTSAQPAGLGADGTARDPASGRTGVGAGRCVTARGDRRLAATPLRQRTADRQRRQPGGGIQARLRLACCRCARGRFGVAAAVPVQAA